MHANAPHAPFRPVAGLAVAVEGSGVVDAFAAGAGTRLRHLGALVDVDAHLARVHPAMPTVNDDADPVL